MHAHNKLKQLAPRAKHISSTGRLILGPGIQDLYSKGHSVCALLELWGSSVSSLGSVRIMIVSTTLDLCVFRLVILSQGAIALWGAGRSF